MIISRAPTRITLAGGGTDLPSYYEQYEGYLIAATINKYIFTAGYRQFYSNIKLKYSKQEEVDELDEIKHPLFREALRMLDITEGIELTSLADIPAGSGLGASGAFLDSLLNTLYLYKYGVEPTKRVVAETACKIELEILKEHEGKQDKYVSAYGGIQAYRFRRGGAVDVIPLANQDMIASELQKNVYIYFTGNLRSHLAGDALKRQDIRTAEGDKETIDILNQVKDQGMRLKKILESGDVDDFGHMLNEYWMLKQKLNPPKNPYISKCYDVAMKTGALGGKIMGASTDVGFFMFYHSGKSKERWEFEAAMQELGLIRLEYTFDMTGVKTIFTGGE